MVAAIDSNHTCNSWRMGTHCLCSFARQTVRFLCNRPQAPATNSTIEQVPATRSPLPSVNSTIGQPILNSTNLNQSCENTCKTENSTVRSRNTRETSYLSASNIIEKHTRSYK